MKRNKKRAIVIIICLLGIIACLMLLNPQIRRQIIIILIEQFLMGQALIDPAMWYQTLFHISIIGCFLLGLLLLYFSTDFLTDYKKQIINTVCKYLTYMNNEIQLILKKNIIIAFFCMFGLYTFAFISIIRADFSYNDDLQRIFYGNRTWYPNSRYINDFLAIFLHTDTRITDISPLSQLIAIFLLPSLVYW